MPVGLELTARAILALHMEELCDSTETFNVRTDLIMKLRRENVLLQSPLLFVKTTNFPNQCPHFSCQCSAELIQVACKVVRHHLLCGGAHCFDRFHVLPITICSPRYVE